MASENPNAPPDPTDQAGVNAFLQRRLAALEQLLRDRACPPPPLPPDSSLPRASAPAGGYSADPLFSEPPFGNAFN